MARNADGSVTLKTTGKVARTPRGSGAQRKSPMALPNGREARVTKQPGRVAVSRNPR